MEDIRFGDDNAKVEKAKQSFLQLKQKICRTNDVIQQYSNKVKECEHLKVEVENAKKESEEWKNKHFADLAKMLEMKTARIALEKNKKMLCREMAEMEIKIAGDQKHLQQLMCKLGDIEDQHSEKLMTIDLQKSGLQSRVAELEKEIKLLHKTYNIKKENVVTKNIEKPKRGRKIKSPTKTTRSTGLLPEIEVGVNSNDDIEDEHVTTLQNHMNLNAMNTREREDEAIPTISHLPKLFSADVANDKSDIIPRNNLFERIPTPKPITCDKYIMTDEFYGVKNDVYPLLCDKCEAKLEMPVDKIFKIMTTLPPLLSTVPPSPIRSRQVDREIQTIDIPTEPNISAQTDSNVSLVLDKVQQTLETLEKQMKENDKKRINEQNIIPHCSHTLPNNCCNHSNNSANDKNLSQVNMMTALWSSMMKFTDKQLPKPHIERKTLSKKKLKHRKEMRKKLKNSLNSWIVESDTSFVTDRDSTINSTPTKSSDVVTVSKNSKTTIIEIKQNNLFDSLEKEPERNTRIDTQNVNMDSATCPDISPHIEDDSIPVHDEEVINSFVNATTSTPSSHSTHLDLVEPKRITRKIAQSLPIDSHPTVDVDPTSRKQMRPANVTHSGPKGRTGLLQKLRRLSKNNQPVNASANVKASNYIEPTDKGRNLPIEIVPEIKKRIAHANKKVLKEPNDIMNEKRTKITRSMARSEPQSIAVKPIHSPTNPERPNEKIKSKRVSNKSIINNLFGSDNYDDEKESEKVEYKIADANVNNVAHKITKCTADIVNTSESIEKHNEHDEAMSASDVQSNTGTDESKNTTANISISNSDGISQNVKSPLIVAYEREYVEVEENVEKMEEKDVIMPSEFIEKNDIDCLPEQMEIDDTNKSTENHSESFESIENNGDCETNAQMINSSVDSPIKNALSTIDTISTNLQLIRTRNSRSISTEPTNSISDVSKETLRKRQRTESFTKSNCEKTPESLTETNTRFVSTLDKLPDESELISPKSSKRKSVPEMIQNELGTFFNSKRIMTRSMKKYEESSSPTSDNPQIKINPLKRFESPKTIKKLRTPVKSMNNTPINISKNFVKNLFANRNYEKRNSNSNIDNDSNQVEESATDEFEAANSIAAHPNIHSNEMNNKSEPTIINNASSELSKAAQVQESSTFAVENEMEIDKNVRKKNLLIETHDKEKLEDYQPPEFATRICCDDDSREKRTREHENDVEKPTHQIDNDGKIPITSSRCDYDFPSSPDPTPVVLSECPASPDADTPFEFASTRVYNSTYSNALVSPVAESTEQLSNITHQQKQEKSSTDSQLTTDLPKSCDSSVRELRNRIVPVIHKTIPAIPKNAKIVSSTSQEVDGNVINIKSLLDKYWSLVNKTEMRAPKYHELAARNASNEFIDKLKQEIMKFANSPNWDSSVYQSVVDNLSKINSVRSITRAIVDAIKELSVLKEPTDQTHTPPAPPMTPSQQKIISIIEKLDKLKPDLIHLIFNAINNQLFRMNQDVKADELKNFAKIFVVLSKIRKDRQRVRMMICDALYALQTKSLLIVHTALTCWPELLPMYNENRRDYLSMTIVHMIQHHDTKNYALTSIVNQLKNLIKRYYNYPDNNPLSTNVVDQLLKELTTPNYDRRILTAILLLAKKEGTEWTYKNIVKEKLLTIIIENKNSSAYSALILLGYLMKCFPLNDTEGSVKSIVEQLCAILNAGTTPVEIQEGAAMALMLLSNRHSKYPALYKSILMWRPPRSLSPALQMQLEILFKSRTREEWQRVKI